MIVEAEGFEPQAKLVEVVDPTHGPAQRLDFDLAPVQVRSRRVLFEEAKTFADTCIDEDEFLRSPAKSAWSSVFS